MPVFSDNLPMPKILRDGSKSAWIRALPPDGGVGSEATLSYILYRSNAQSVSKSDSFVLFSDVLISHPNVLVKLDKKRRSSTKLMAETANEVRSLKVSDLPYRFSAQ